VGKRVHQRCNKDDFQDGYYFSKKPKIDGTPHPENIKKKVIRFGNCLWALKAQSAP